MDKNCVFCKIVNGVIKHDIIYSDEDIVAFLDTAPINKGHILVVPREHYVGAASIPEPIAGKMFHLAARLGIACKRAFECDGYNLHLADGFAAGQEIPHAHLHMVPRFIDDGFHWNWRQVDIAENEISEFSEKIKSKLKIQWAVKVL